MTENTIEQVRPLGWGRYEVLMFPDPLPREGGWFGYITVVWSWRRATKLAELYRPRVL